MEQDILPHWSLTMIKQINNFSAVESKFEELDFNDGTQKLFFDGNPTGKKISGDAISQQFKIGKYYLLIMYQDGAFEGPDYFSAVLLDKQFNQIVEKFITLEGVDLILKDAVPIKDNEIKITFADNCSVILQICKIPFLPFNPFLKLKEWEVIRSN